MPSSATRATTASPSTGARRRHRAAALLSRTFKDIEVGLESFARTFDCAGAGRVRARTSPSARHPPGRQIYARCATSRGITVNWAGSGTSTPSALQLELIQRLKPTILLCMSSYALHLANLAEARGWIAFNQKNHDLGGAGLASEARQDRTQLRRQAHRQLGMTEAGMMGSEDVPGAGFRIWSDLYYIEVLEPKSLEPAKEGEVGTLVVTALQTNNVTPFLRWSSGDLVTYSEADDGTGPFSVFPRVKHAHRTAGFFKVRA